MKPTQTNNETYTMTLADLCEALADGRLAASRDEQYYTVRKQDLRRFAQSAEMAQITRLNPTNTVLDQFYAAS